MINQLLLFFRSRKLKQKEKLWAKEQSLLDREHLLKKERGAYKTKISTSKLMSAFLLINLTLVEIYSMWIMFELKDLSSLSTLITAVIGDVMTYAVYCFKSTKENTEGGIVFESMKRSVDETDNVKSNVTSDEEASG